MSALAEERIESLGQRFETDSLHHGLIFRGDEIPFLEQSVCILYRKILGMSDDASVHPDLFHLRPSGKARIITVEKTRMLISDLYRSGHQGSRKVAIIHETDRMKKEAANAFLKTLEEPPSGTYLFLLTMRPYSILPTLRSRCIMVRLDKEGKKQDNEVWSDWLSKYQAWINLLLDREKLKADRVSPVFMAYGLIESLSALIKTFADSSAKNALGNLTVPLEDKERDAYESGLRRGIRTNILMEISQHTRDYVIDQNKIIQNLGRNGQKLSRIISQLERINGLLEVNLKEEAAIEDFLLSSLRIWSAK